jgi:arsenite methyltransferase
MSQDAKQAISVRYSALADSSCCLSCGGAATYAEPQEGEVCVDLGSGRGTDALRMADQVGTRGMVYGIDLSEGMLEKARRTAERLGVANARFLRAELEELPLEDGVADLVISNCTINHADDKLKVWQGIQRVLKPGGRFVVSDIYSLEPVPERYRQDPQAVAECWAGAVTREEYFRQLGQAGFPEVRVLEESAPYDKGAIRVASFTIAAVKPGGSDREREAAESVPAPRDRQQEPAAARGQELPLVEKKSCCCG